MTAPLLAIAAFSLLGSSGQDAGSFPGVKVEIIRADSRTSTLTVAITNSGDRTVCAERGRGARAFDVSRMGQPMRMSDGIPHVSIRDRCNPIEPGATSVSDYELAIAWPDLRRDDRVCFEAWIRFRDEPDSPNTTVVDCRLLD